MENLQYINCSKKKKKEHNNLTYLKHFLKVAVYLGQIWLISYIVLWIFSYRSYIYRSVLLKETDIYRHRLKIASHHKCSFKWYHIWYWYNVRRYFFFFMHIIWGAKTKTEDGRRLYVQNIHTSICPCFHSVIYVYIV